MDEQRLIDANSLLSGIGNYDLQVVVYKNDDRLEIMTKVVQAVQDHAAKCVSDAPTIDPESLPIVQQLRAELAKVKAEKDEYKELFFSYKHVCGGIAPQRIGELVEADKDGRCVVFPCRPSDVTVYQLRNKKHARGIGVHPRHIHCATVWADGKYEFEHQGMEPCKGKDLGKTWFLTEEAAEAALAKEEGQCDVK